MRLKSCTLLVWPEILLMKKETSKEQGKVQNVSVYFVNDCKKDTIKFTSFNCLLYIWRNDNSLMATVKEWPCIYNRLANPDSEIRV